MSELPWFRFYHEAINDEKIVLTAARTHQTYLEILGVWTIMLSLAAKSPIRGTLMLSDQSQYYENDLAALCHLEIENMDLIIRAFVQLNMLEYDEDTHVMKIKNWEERQETKEERANRLHAERQKRYAEKHKSVSNDAQMTQDSISISNSLIKESLNEKTIFTTRDAERAYIQVTGFASVPGNMLPRLENIVDLLQRYGWDETINRLTKAKNDWTKQKRASNGANWRLTNPGWIDYAITGESLVSPPKQTQEERELKIIEAMAKRNQ